MALSCLNRCNGRFVGKQTDVLVGNKYNRKKACAHKMFEDRLKKNFCA